MNAPLAGQTALIIGANGGIGAAVARALGAAGATSSSQPATPTGSTGCTSAAKAHVAPDPSIADLKGKRA